MQKQIKQTWKHVEQWEEIPYNMWGEVDNRQFHLDQAIAFTGDHKLYGSYMLRVVNEWPISCENALTDPHMNRKAWLGHAAVALAKCIPEDITRQAWGFLNDEQKFLANKEAERAIEIWERNYIQSRGLQEHVGISLLFGWDT